ncbi:hypothetical protein BH708_19210 [Brachybacterium sp. P6-10-X1]|uniref:hypothetical protein n=1 Tax=Brachybacterium sp. P6-10-X1 TaxID=1903186 RepID=UPI000971A019|nr:hypothetical protein [Brachybacterium sp. P6-10-X1]APX34488.1 hypothetical protein BH708_19210 [Brachybacterium sp. P6-10-X1]
MSDEQTSTALSPTRDAALARPDFPFTRVARRLGIDPAEAEVALRDDDRARTAIARTVGEFLEADDARRAGRAPESAMGLDPDFPTGVGMALVGAAVLWEARDLVPQVALRVAKDHYEDGADELAASYIALVQESVDPGAESRDDAIAWAAQSLLVSVLQRSGDPAQAAEIARDLAAHAIPIDLWRDDDPSLPDDSMSWHGGAFVGGIPPRRDERSLSYEDVHDYMNTLLADMRREQEAEE